ncbi:MULTISPECIES: efflux transporter outer membrane subunit [unclassified Janthinobacterium]|uniref:efflux transporter outer membrane subunit n=1 Tax=unclassified Janthinobacterium TaxID=2610881 RepID=UPI00160FBDF2|nr:MULTISPECIES: efflux transporter outer membrane subunit [unclassified Janthinobacterium]MBB5370049.1 NodT family efflux transporter outer membrane factor (OMF) lipoprotein [Janthinobacterium sp. K2C7]MBB5382855.1 NodT family efflux transporter outer membrane factor (OMF) lipoprotein [Janthinobacterium sp. K2Li3]MBB5384840.1 NodT family efflux transporter outer membrane factor (OMF) lipoprotein [Janthinobacterium sp. K2E3]
MMLRYFTLSILALSLSACSLTPALLKPASPVPASYGPTLPEAGGNAADLGWRLMLLDARLQRLVELALQNNRDLRLAALNVDDVRAQYQIQDAARYPAVGAALGGTRQRGTDKQFTAGIAMSAFEIDLFGRLRSLSDAAFARYLATVEGQRAARLVLIAAVADAYLEERLAEEQLLLSRQTLHDWREALILTQRLRAAQQGSSLDVAQAEGQAAQAEADVLARERALLLAHNQLVLLLGGPLPDQLPSGRPLASDPVLTQLPAGVPSDLLVRRPDIVQAEYALVAANAEIGVARAAFFPRLSLTAQLGLASPELGDLFRGGARSWSFAPQITQPLFQGGQLRAELQLSKIRTQAAVLQYEQAIATAFREVSDGLAGSATYASQISAQQRVVDASGQRQRLSALRYGAGQDSRLELLDAQRQSYAAQQTLLDLRRDQFKSAIALYKALGGGLEE